MTNNDFKLYHCVSVVRNLSDPFKVYIRFSSNFTSVIPSGNSSAVLDNIRIIVRQLLLICI